jgi:cystathionine beta-lyase
VRYDFDSLPDRRNTFSYKWDAMEKEFGSANLVPLWVADMDFPSPPQLLAAIEKRLKQGVLGYTFASQSCAQSIAGWLQRRHGWKIERDWILLSPNVVFSVNTAITAFTEPGDRVIVQPPVYPPLFRSVLRNGREIVYNPLKLSGDRYEMDLQDLAEKLKSPTRMLVLCSPHNPVGRVWQREELVALADLCLSNDVMIVSDEIHFDLVFGEYRHIPTASLGSEIAASTITLSSPSKTFNIPGIHSSYAIISELEARRKFDERMRDIGLSCPSLFGVVATEAAYNHCSGWVDELLDYLWKNLEFVIGFFREHLPSINPYKPEGTYLVWLDFSKLGLDDEELKEFLVSRAGLGLSPGTTFGPGGEGFQRMNIGCPRSLLERALLQLKKAYEDLGL